MKLCKIAIKGYRQFQDVVLDFTHPKTGAPLDKICFIGRNGTGKSTVLKTIGTFLKGPMFMESPGGLLAVQVESANRRRWIITVNRNGEFQFGPYAFRDDVKEIPPDWLQEIELSDTLEKAQSVLEKYQSLYCEGDAAEKFFREIQLASGASDLLIYCPPETPDNKYVQVHDVPKTTVNDALKLFKDFPFYHQVSKNSVETMWQTLVFLIKKRESEWQTFAEQPENQARVLGEVKAEFNRQYPEILPKLADLWDGILGQTKLELDVEGASNPVQLTDNLQAYIRLKHGDKSKVPYSELSTGIRNFIFTIGHIFLLYFGRDIKRGFLLVDEPENSLFPDFLFDLMETYERIVRNERGETGTQIFMATHNPIVAAQFEPYERVVLDWNDDGSVSARKGVAPKGDDPNDVLRKDFELPDLMGKAGQDMWKRYLALKSEARRNNADVDKQLELESKASDIARTYNFMPREN